MSVTLYSYATGLSPPKIRIRVTPTYGYHELETVFVRMGSDAIA